MRHSTLGPGGEFDILRRIIAAQGGRDDDTRHVLVGPGDDCVVVRGGPFALSVDLSIEGVHFCRDWLTPHDIGYRSAMASLSDLAATAATPIGILAAIAVPAEEAETLAAEIAAGANEAAAVSGAVVLGGDLTRSPGPIIVDVVAVGETASPVTRSGAAEGDTVWVTGQLGGAAAAVSRWRAGALPPADAVLAFARPAARIAEALWLAGRGLMRAAIDLSDGLAGDAGHIAAASGCAIVLEPSLLPVHPAARAAGDDDHALALALGGGDDYELCFISKPGAVEPHAAAFERTFGVRITRVGVVEAGDGVHVRDNAGRTQPLAAHGFSHFARTGP